MLDQAFDLHRFLEVIQLVGLNPPRRGFHQEFWIVILVVEERIEGQADVGPFLADFAFANSNNFLSQRCTHFTRVSEVGWGSDLTKTEVAKQSVGVAKDEIQASWASLLDHHFDLA